MRFLPLLLALLCTTHLTAQTPTNTTRRIYLSGTDAEHTRTWDFYCSGGQQSGKWRTIEVPSCWELQGYGEYTYGRFYKTKGVHGFVNGNLVRGRGVNLAVLSRNRA